jgi:hypothetical protein
MSILQLFESNTPNTAFLPYVPLLIGLGTGLVSAWDGIVTERHYVAGRTIVVNSSNTFVSLIPVLLSGYFLYFILTGFSIFGIIRGKKSVSELSVIGLLLGGKTTGGIGIWLGLESQEDAVRTGITQISQFFHQTINFDPFFPFYLLGIILLTIHILARIININHTG